ncbi:dihydrofolate reductase family protein [Phytoactinopolyspora alkaliphila]|uniref:Dihydrofolate reductase family protein n=1 Tax=Phytoactinopolyspora alkaliphila TaxID=1783498 RepID=A0A6N9YR53_9ACTN|nr:dihydrofolate reductase family protein [Phytoactinopolyspora alkaliphila]NED97464.1 dihydrofolate reductase family protein [Phytoactinopolyspora alkaliphila]
MGTVAVTTFVSMDGVLQGPGGPGEDPSNGFDLGGWLVPHADEDMGRIVGERFARADAFLLGRKTYEIFAGYWPGVTDPDDPVASRLNTLPKYVASTTLSTPEWAGSTVIAGNLADEVAALKQRHTREIQVHGSGDLVQSLRELDLIDLYHVWTYPVVLGTGKRLFPEGCVSSALELIDTQATSTGVVVSTYRPAGAVKTGTF